VGLQTKQKQGVPPFLDGELESFPVAPGACAEKQASLTFYPEAA
jgi:hypothetical protein